MKYVKILGLLAVAAAALMAFAGSASATTITSPTGTAIATGTTIHAVSAEKAVPGTKHLLIHNSIQPIKCESTITYTYDHTSETGTATGIVDALSFFNCTGPWVVDVIATGSLELHGEGSYDAILTSRGERLAATHTEIGISCIYETAPTGTQIGTMNGGNPATLEINGSIPRVGGSFLCGGASASWTGLFETTGAYYLD